MIAARPITDDLAKLWMRRAQEAEAEIEAVRQRYMEELDRCHKRIREIEKGLIVRYQ